jgi:hypothetical protein
VGLSAHAVGVSPRFCNADTAERSVVGRSVLNAISVVPLVARIPVMFSTLPSPEITCCSMASNTHWNCWSYSHAVTVGKFQ